MHRSFSKDLSRDFMNYLLIPDKLRTIAEKIESRQSISDADALELYRSNDLNALGIMASAVRERKNGNYATYIHNRYINYSNICILSCQFCAFAAKKRDAHAFEQAIEEIVERCGTRCSLGVTEVHMVGGLHPTLKKDWYLRLVRSLRALDPDLHIKAFTAIEIRHLARSGFSHVHRETLETLREAGLGSITGGGAEIFDPAVRDEICRGKETRGRMAGCPSHLARDGWPQHLHDALWPYRDARRSASIICANSASCRMKPAASPGLFRLLSNRKRRCLRTSNAASAFEQLRNLAVSRIYLDNFDHLTAYWVSMGLPLAQVALSYGVDDLHGTIIEEKIFHMAGATTPQQQTSASLENAIREAGREPVQRDSHYRHINSTRHAQRAMQPVEPSLSLRLTCRARAPSSRRRAANRLR